MRSCLFIATILFLCSFQTEPGNAQSCLSKISKSQTRDSVQLFFSFDTPPRYSKKITGKRLDIVLTNTVIDENPVFFEADDKIIKMLTRSHGTDSIISLFFRYTPQKVAIVSGKDPVLVADILLGNRFSKTYDTFMRELEGVTLLDRKTKDFSNPLVASRYAHDWKTFFSFYESPLTLDAPVKAYTPDFPIIRILPPGKTGNSSLIPEKTLVHASEGAWFKVSKKLEEMIAAEPDRDIKKLLALSYGESLMHADNFEGAYKQFFLLKEKYPTEQVGLFSSYLLAILIVTHGDPYGGNYELKALSQKLNNNHPLLPYVLLSLAETELATSQLDDLAATLERDDLAYPPEIEFRRELRQADYYHATNKMIKAFVAYDLAAEKSKLKQQPYSLNGYCSALYDQSAFAKSSECYSSLTRLIAKPSELAKAFFRSSMAKLKSRDEVVKLITEFSRIEDAFPGTEAGFRAALKKTDLQYLTRKKWSGTALKYYRALGEKSIYRRVSEEAYFKEALLYHFAGNNEKSIALTMTLLRNFRSGSIRPHAEALLIQLVPSELKRLIAEKKYTAAITLAKQNRKLFDNNWIDISILSDLACAYRQIGMFNDALKLYRYLAEVSGANKKEQYFLPLTEVAYEKGDDTLVQDFSDQYHYLYPEGTYRKEIDYLRLSSLLENDRIDRALALMPDPLPDDNRYVFLAATLHYRAKQYKKVSDLLFPLYQAEIPMKDDLHFMLAESLFVNEDNTNAEAIYKKSRKTTRYRDQASYRLAEIARKKGDDEEALHLLTDIAEGKDDDSIWKKYAVRDLQISQLTENL